MRERNKNRRRKSGPCPRYAIECEYVFIGSDADEALIMTQEDGSHIIATIEITGKQDVIYRRTSDELSIKEMHDNAKLWLLRNYASEDAAA